MPRAAPNRPSRAGPYERSSKLPDPQNLTAEGLTGGRRESGLRALSRRISQVFTRATGRAAEHGPDERPEPVPESNRSVDLGEPGSATNDSLVTSQPSIASRAPSASRKTSVNLSLLRSQPDMRLPAHMIVEAYREALKEKGEAPVQKRVASSSSAAADAPPRKAARTHRPSERNSVVSVSSSNLSVRKPKPVKHKIQLVTKPVLDLSTLPDDRKSRPGFISANFDVSDDDSDVESGSTKESESAAALLRRPQVASDKLQRALTEVPEEDSTRPTTDAPSSAPAFAFGNSKDSVANGPLQTGSTQKAQPPAGSDTPKFSFEAAIGGQSSASQESKPQPDAPNFSFGAGASAPQPKTGSTFNFSSKTNSANAERPLFGSQGATEQLGDKPKFNFGGADSKADNASNGNSNVAKDTTSTPAPLFSFGTESNKPASEKPADKPIFSFGGGAADKASAGPTFSFGAQSTDSAKKAEDKPTTSAPTFSFNAKTNEPPQFSFGANGSNKAMASTENSNEPIGEAKKSAFGFAEPSASKLAAPSELKPAFNFGSTPAINAPAPSNSLPDHKASTSSQDANGGQKEKPATGFSFSAPNTAEKSAFSFGAATDKPADTASGSTASGQRDNTPAFSFGAPSTGAPTFNFGASQAKPDEKPNFAFGTSTAGSADSNGSKSAFSFGAPNGGTANTEAKPAATFGQPGGAGGAQASTSQKPSISFGASEPASPAPFGSKNAAPSTMNFGASSQRTSGSNAGPASSTSQPAFLFGGANNTTFGGPSAQGQTPFAFGAQPQSQTQVPQAFQFGAAAAPGSGKASTPFAFGSPAPGAGETPPNFAFGQPQGAAAPSQFGSRESTPGPGVSQQRKIAQVKRRLRR